MQRCMSLALNCLQLLIVRERSSLLRLEQVLVHGIEHIQVTDILRIVIGNACHRMHELKWDFHCAVILPAKQFLQIHLSLLRVGRNDGVFLFVQGCIHNLRLLLRTQILVRLGHLSRLGLASRR